MTDHNTLYDVLLSMSEAKLRRLRDGTKDEIQRLADSLRIVESALAKKQGAKASSEVSATNGHGRANELSRNDLFAYVVEYGQPVKAGPLSKFLATKGIVRSPQAVRMGLVRLEKDGKLELLNGSYVVAK